VTPRGALVPPALCLILGACNSPLAVDVPAWPDGGYLSQTRPLTPAARQALEGVYLVEQGQAQFGDTVVMRWNGSYLGVYTGVNAGYLVMQAGSTDTSVYVEGYWRYQNSERTGLAQMWAALPVPGSSPLRLTGQYGDGEEHPSHAMAFRFLRRIKPALLSRPYYFISHHGSGGVPEYLPASENTVEIARIIERFAANAIEVDARISKDGIPFLYHDTGLNWRLTQKGPLVGPAENFTMAQLKASVRLIRGEQIPTLEEFLDAVVTQTTLSFVYVDLKPSAVNGLPAIVAIQKAALAKAASRGRNVQIYLAITSDEILANFVTLPGYQEIPTICELGIDKLDQANSQVWSPRFTQDIPDEDIARLHSEGKLAITWTVNVNSFLRQFIEEGLLDGVLTDYTTLAAYYYFKQ
jgi:glycerophosphoryl diester phosphodiesterase